MDIGLIVEGHAGLTWERWTRILRTAEDVGLASVFRSDHFFIGRERDSLEAFLSFVVAATETKRIRFGGLVSPVTFRTPADVGRMAAQLDGLSDGRFCLGLGCPVPEIRRDRAKAGFQHSSRIVPWTRSTQPLVWGRPAWMRRCSAPSCSMTAVNSRERNSEPLSA